MPNNMQYVNCPLPPRKTLLVSSQRVMDPLQWSLMSNLHPSCANIQVRRRQNDYLSFPLTCGRCHGSRYHYNLFIVSARLTRAARWCAPHSPDTVSIVNTRSLGDTRLQQRPAISSIRGCHWSISSESRLLLAPGISSYRLFF